MSQNLLDLLNKIQTSPTAQLTFDIEELGEYISLLGEDLRGTNPALYDKAVDTLYAHLDHKSPIVVEGAILGASWVLDIPKIYIKVHALSNSGETVAPIARDVLLDSDKTLEQMQQALLSGHIIEYNSTVANKENIANKTEVRWFDIDNEIDPPN